MLLPINKDNYRKIKLAISNDVNEIIFKKFQGLSKNEIKHKSHLFYGRYENIYIENKSIPELEKIISMIKHESALFLSKKDEEIHMGFWFNVMSPGDQTTLHCHDDLDEILSGVYYIRVPDKSGSLVLEMDETIEIIPEEGMMVMFSPKLNHKVTVNKSNQTRLSIGFNVTSKSKVS